MACALVRRRCRCSHGRSGYLTPPTRWSRPRALAACSLGIFATVNVYQTCYSQVPAPSRDYAPPKGGNDTLPIVVGAVTLIGIGAGLSKPQPGCGGELGKLMYNQPAAAVPPGCASCHGPRGDRVVPQREIPSLIGSTMTRAQMREIIKTGRVGEGKREDGNIIGGVGTPGFMPRYKTRSGPGRWTDAEIEAVIDYVRCLQEEAKKQKQ